MRDHTFILLIFMEKIFPSTRFLSLLLGEILTQHRWGKQRPSQPTVTVEITSITF